MINTEFYFLAAFVSFRINLKIIKRNFDFIIFIKN